MQKISQLICLTTFLVLVATICMARTNPNHIQKNLQNEYCATATMKDEACHKDHCSSSTTYVHTCDYYNGTNCDYYTGHLDICNSSSCQNTTRHVTACYHDISDNCGDVDITCHSCTDDVCRNRTTNFHLCRTNGLNSAASAFCTNCYVGIYAIECIDNVVSTIGRRFVSSK